MLGGLNQLLRINVKWSLVLHLDHFMIYFWHQKRAQHQLDAERQQLEADLKIERQHREAQLQASHRER